MSTSRSIAAEVVRLLSDSRAPICFFDDDRRVVFANPACALWIGVPLAELIGRRASFSSADRPDSTPADGLCPPPDAFAGQRISGVVFASAEGQLRRRQAEFVPLDAVDGGSVPVLVLCSATDESEADRQTAEGPNDDSTILHERVAQFHAQQRRRFRLEHLVGDSAAMQLAKAQVQAAIASHANVTVVGPPGSSRQRLARTIHYNSELVVAGEHKDRNHDNLVVLDGSLLTGDVVHSAVVALTAQGRVSPVTVLLLHLDLLPSDLQPEIVRLFVHRFAARLLATSEAPPSELAALGQLHPQLASAASTLVVRLPTLAQRRKDIPLLAQFFVEGHNAKGNKQLRGFAPEAIDELVAYSWPGDVAELRGFVEEAFARAEGFEITPADLPRRLSQTTSAVRRPPRGPESIVLEDCLAGIERELIERALREAKGNKARAARLLGLTRPRLYRRMVQLGLEPEPGASIVADGPTATKTTDVEHSKVRKLPGRKSAASRHAESSAAAETSEQGADFIEDIPFEEQPE